MANKKKKNNPPPANGGANPNQPLPFAGPVSSHKPVDPVVAAKLKAFDAQYGNRHNEPVPVLHPDPVWQLADVIGAQRTQAIAQSGVLTFHSVGDTGYDSYPISSQGVIR